MLKASQGCLLMIHHYYNSSNNINEIGVIVNSDLSKMYNWSKEWLVDFNPKKTECIIFSTNQAAN